MADVMIPEKKSNDKTYAAVFELGKSIYNQDKASMTSDISSNSGSNNDAMKRLYDYQSNQNLA